MSNANLARARGRTSGAVLLLLVGLAGCASKKLYERNREHLGRAWTRVGSGELQSAERELQLLLRDTSVRPQEYAFQRFHAALLLARLHASASLDRPFLTEAVEAGFLQRRESRGSPIAHLMAAGLWASYGVQWLDRAMVLPTVADGVPLLPQEWDGAGIDALRDELAFVLLYVHARLGFQDRIELSLAHEPSLHDHASFAPRLEAARVPVGMRPWIHLAIYRHLRDKDVVRAFPFAVQTLQSAAEAEPAPSREALDAVRAWLTANSDYEFVCPDDHNPILLDLWRCPICNETTQLEFVPRRREGGAGRARELPRGQ